MRINQIRFGVVLEYMQVLLKCLMSIGVTPIILSKLGSEEYGIYNISLSLTSYLGIMSGIFTSAYMRQYAIYTKEKNRQAISDLNGLYFALYAIMGSIALVIGIVLSIQFPAFYNDSLNPYGIGLIAIQTKILSFNVFISFIFNVFYVFLTATERFVFQKSINIITTVLNTGITVLLLVKGSNSTGIVISTTLITLLIGSINIFFCFKYANMTISFKNFDLSLFKHISICSLYIFLTTIVSEINYNLDKVILGKLQDATVVSRYTIGSMFNNYFRILGISLTSIFVPKINFLLASGKVNHFSELLVKIVSVQLIVLMYILGGFAAFGKRFIYLWVGEDYSTSFIVGLLLMISTVIPILQDSFIATIRAMNKHKFLAIVTASCAIGNIILTLYLSRDYGEIGAALATALTVVLSNGIIMSCYYYRIVKIHYADLVKSVFRFFISIIIPYVFLIVENYFFDNLPFLVVLILYSMIYFSCVYFIYFPQTIRLAILHRFHRRL